jgi:hypothetical protein
MKPDEKHFSFDDIKISYNATGCNFSLVFSLDDDKIEINNKGILIGDQLVNTEIVPHMGKCLFGQILAKMTKGPHKMSVVSELADLRPQKKETPNFDLRYLDSDLP